MQLATSLHSLYLPIPARCPCCHSPRTQSPSPQHLSTSNRLWDHQGFLFLSFRFPPHTWPCQSLRASWAAALAKSMDFYNSILSFHTFSVDFLFLWNLPFKFTGTRLFLGSACILFPFLFSTTGHRTESHCRQDYLMVPPGLSLPSLPPQPVNPSTHSVLPPPWPSHKAVPLDNLFHVLAEKD